jgi:hypothetical protein
MSQHYYSGEDQDYGEGDVAQLVRMVSMMGGAAIVVIGAMAFVPVLASVATAFVFMPAFLAFFRSGVRTCIV